MYHYTECGLDNIYLQNGYNESDLDGESYISIDSIDELHAAIGELLVEQSIALSPKEFRFLRTELNLSQKVLGGILDVDGQTVARWEKGETNIPRTSDVVLRAIYLESIDKDSSVALMLQALSETEAQKTIERIVLAEENHNWGQAA
ncbi:MAG: helix-turn-helix domain-containing protein [Pseudomonadota bacterium]